MSKESTDPRSPKPRDAPTPWVVVLGATSPIARAVAGELAARNHRLLLAGRDVEELERTATDLRVRYGCEVATLPLDVLDSSSLDAFVSRVADATEEELGGVVSAIGSLGDQDRAATDPGYAVELLHTNFVGVVRVLTGLAALLQRHGRGFIVGISSVAGERGRQSNFVYGSAKGGLTLWLQGLRNRLWHSGVRVITVKPGFVDTEMTFGMPGLFLVADPDAVGAAIVRAIEARRNVVYVPWFWRYILWVIRAIPEALFKRLRL